MSVPTKLISVCSFFILTFLLSSCGKGEDGAAPTVQSPGQQLGLAGEVAQILSLGRMISNKTEITVWDCLSMGEYASRVEAVIKSTEPLEGAPLSASLERAARRARSSMLRAFGGSTRSSCPVRGGSIGSVARWRSGQNKIQALLEVYQTGALDGYLQRIPRFGTSDELEAKQRDLIVKYQAWLEQSGELVKSLEEGRVHFERESVKGNFLFRLGLLIGETEHWMNEAKDELKGERHGIHSSLQRMRANSNGRARDFVVLSRLVQRVLTFLTSSRVHHGESQASAGSH